MSEPLRSADILVSQVEHAPGVLEKVKTNPVATLRALAKEVTANLPPPAFVSDKWTYRLVVIALGIVAIASVGGAIYLTKDVPDMLTALGAASIGALAGLLAPSPGK